MVEIVSNIKFRAVPKQIQKVIAELKQNGNKASLLPEKDRLTLSQLQAKTMNVIEFAGVFKSAYYK